MNIVEVDCTADSQKNGRRIWRRNDEIIKSRMGILGSGERKLSAAAAKAGARAVVRLPLHLHWLLHLAARVRVRLGQLRGWTHKFNLRKI